MQEQENGNMTFTQTEIQEIEKIAKKHPVINKLYKLYIGYTEDNTFEIKAIINSAMKDIRWNQEKKSLNFEDDKNQKALWEILKGGAAVLKSLTALKEKASAPPEPKTDGAQKEDAEPTIIPITPETARK